HAVLGCHLQHLIAQARIVFRRNGPPLMLRVVFPEPLVGAWRLRRHHPDHFQVWIDDGSVGAIVEERTHGHQGDDGHDAKQDAGAPASEKALRFFGHVGIHQPCADHFFSPTLTAARRAASRARASAAGSRPVSERCRSIQVPAWTQCARILAWVTSGTPGTMRSYVIVSQPPALAKATFSGGRACFFQAAISLAQNFSSPVKPSCDSNRPEIEMMNGASRPVK